MLQSAKAFALIFKSVSLFGRSVSASFHSICHTD